MEHFGNSGLDLPVATLSNYIERSWFRLLGCVLGSLQPACQDQKGGGGDTNKGTIKAIASLLVAGSHGVLIIVLLSGNLSGDFYLISLKVGFIFFLFESPKRQMDK